MNKNSNRVTIYPLIGALLLIVGFLMGAFLFMNKQTVGTPFYGRYNQKLNDIIDILERDYVDSVDKEQLFERAITDLLHGLDPHSNYIPAEKLAQLNENIQGNFGGVGIRFIIYDDTLNVVNVILNSPAFKVGIEKFDRIIKVDTFDIANGKLTNERVRELLKGKAGTPVNVVVLRKGQLYEKKIIRGLVPIESINAAYMMTKEVGYIKLSEFSMTSGDEFYRAAIELKQKGMKKLIFDLRYNGGGVMSSAISIAEAFLQKGSIIVSTKGKNTREEIIRARTNPILGDVKVAVLINSSSASASEIVAGAIQDNDRGTIVGRRSFGKGLVQQDFPLTDGSDLRLTIARYYTPTGRSIQKPYSENFEEYYNDELSRYESGELYHMDSTLLVDSLKYITPGGKTVYGGGGIWPDVFVGLDTSGNSFYYRKLQFSNAFNDFAYFFARNHNLSKYSDYKAFSKHFVISDEMLRQFTLYAENQYTIPYDKKGLEASKSRITTSIKAEIARHFWLETGAFYIYNQGDREIEAALKELED